MTPLCGLLYGLPLPFGLLARLVGLDVVAPFEAGEADDRDEPVRVLVDGDDNDFL